MSKTISDLIAASKINDTDNFVLEQGNAAKKLSGLVLKGHIQTISEDSAKGAVTPYVQRAEAAAQNADASATSAAESLSDAITAKNQAGSAAAQALFAKKACQDSAAVAADAADAAAESAAEIQNAASQIQANSDAIDDLRTAQAETLAVLSGTDRRLKYLWKKNNGILYDTETLTGSGPVVDVPSGAMDFAELQMIGGMSRKGKNLCQYTTPSKDNFFPIFGGGDTGDGSLLAAGTYVVSYQKKAQKSVLGYVETMPGNNQIVSAAQGTFSFTLTNATKIRAWLYFPDNTTVISEAQLELGSTATSYEPYAADLIDAKVDQINSIGRNILPQFYTERTTINGIDVNPHADGSISIKGTASQNATIMLSSNRRSIRLNPGIYTLSLGTTTPTGVYIRAELYNGLVYSHNLYPPTFTILDNEKFYSFESYVLVEKDTTVDLTCYAQLEKGTQSTNYTRYRKETVTIPALVQALDGYGIGVSESVYNFIDFSQRKYHKRVGSVDLGSLTWIYKPNYGPAGESIFESQAIEGMVNSYTTNIYSLPSMIQSKYVLLNPNKQYQDNSYGSISAWSTNASSIFVNILVRDNNYTNANEFKSAMSGVMLYFELATDEIIDLSEVLTDFNPITQVEACGSLQLHYPQLDNRYDVAVPSQTDIMVDLSEVL